jgi:hypothetical protein
MSDLCRVIPGSGTIYNADIGDFLILHACTFLSEYMRLTWQSWKNP